MHCIPVVPVGHKHKKPSTASKHVPPLLHGFDKHSSTSHTLNSLQYDGDVHAGLQLPTFGALMVNDHKLTSEKSIKKAYMSRCL